MKNLPLSGLKILDLSQYVSGSYCTKLLASYGADVVKIEHPDGGDKARSHGPFPNDIPDPENSALFLYLNTNKKSVTLNLKIKAGNAIFNELVKRSDILVENSGPSSIDYEAIRKINASIIITSISWFGQTSPYRDYQGSDIIAQALGGIMKMTGLRDREPLKIAGPQAEYQAGINAAIATMAALYLRDETGIGQHIDISVMECLASILEGALLSNAYDGTLRQRDGARHPTIYPSTILPCKDGFIHIDASTNWGIFANFMEMPELLQFKPEELREKADEIDSLLTAKLATQNSEDLFRKAQEWRLPFAKVMGINELPDDHQFQERSFFQQIDGLNYPGIPFKMSQCQPIVRRAPTLGEHNQEMLCDMLGYSKDDLIKLRGMGVI